VTQSDDEDDSKRDAPKERVLHTRVPAVLERELKKLAKNLRMPVSNVVRAILEDAVDAVDTVSERAEGRIVGFAERVAKQREELRSRVRGEEEDAETSCPSEASELEGAFGYQPLVLAQDARCAVCGRALRAGQQAHRALFDDPGKRVLLGPECRLLPEKES
jgi:hypothetical protein